MPSVLRSAGAFSLCVLILALPCCGSSSNQHGAPTFPPEPCQALTSDGGGVTIGSGIPGDPAIPIEALSYRSRPQLFTSHTYMVVAGTPQASAAACEVLKAGGNAVDAAIAAQMMLGLTEPFASGAGGGAFLLYYDARTGTVQSYDGRETAPATATENYLRFVDDATDLTSPVPTPRASGRSIGTPGVLRMLELAHQDHGKVNWADLFTPAIELATTGFPISGRLAGAILLNRDPLLLDAEATATYFNADRTAKPMGTVLRVPNYAATLTAIARGGADAFYTGDIAQAIVDKIHATAGAAGAPVTPGTTTLADLAAYQAKRRDPICIAYRSHEVCGMPPPTSGGLAVAQTLGILENFDLSGDGPAPGDRDGGVPQVAGVHLVAEAERLAYADRDKYVADTDFVPLPGGSPAMMLDNAYLEMRSTLISTTASLGTAPAGNLGTTMLGVDRTPEHGTTQISIIDGEGNAVAMTSSVESPFGSYHMTRGVILNNQLTDFSAVPTDGSGAPIANRVAAGKRPRSSMSPTLVFQRTAAGSRGPLVMATGSPGGAAIIQYVVKTLVGTLDWGLDAQQSASLVDFGAANDPTTNVGGENPDIGAANQGASGSLVTGLRALGHTVSVAAQTSGIATVVRMPDGSLAGGADPRRDAVVLGDLIAPAVH
jgi:gamma-glutamyltranspeptidase/glutathione hydrolase